MMKKKMIKRAGVAVLSMAMLLSMGAVGGLTASAAGEAKSITVSNLIDTNGDALTGANAAAVNVYQVAKRDTLGVWSWNTTTPTVSIDVSGTHTDLPVLFEADATHTVANKGTTWMLLSQLNASQLNELAKNLEDANNLADLEVSPANSKTGTAFTIVDKDNTDPTPDIDVDIVGYYLIKTTSASADAQPILKEIDGTSTTATTVTPKATGIPFSKTIEGVVTEKSSNDFTDAAGVVSASKKSSTATVGSKVDYKIHTLTPSYATRVVPANFVITDDPTNGITINSAAKEETGATAFSASDLVVKVDNVVVFGYDSTAEEYKTTEGVNVAALNGGFTVTLSGAYVANHQDKAVDVTFTATINANAVIGDQTAQDANQTVTWGTPAVGNTSFTGNPNTAGLSYGNNFSTGEHDDNGNKHDTVNTFVGKIELVKNVQGGSTTFGNATFLLKKGNTPVSNDKISAGVITTTNTGAFDFGYLEPGTYTLEETAAPHGYSAVGTYSFEVKGKNSANDPEYTTCEVEETTAVTNVALTYKAASGANSTNKVMDSTITVTDPVVASLPGTGGIGTYIFTFGGAAVVLFAGFMFVLYMRKRRTEEE